MFCKNCGRQLADNATFCPGCGTKRSVGGESYEDGRSGADMKNLPNYTKETELNRSDFVVDTNRKKFSLSDSGQNKFSLSGQKKFSLSDSGQSRFTLQDKSRKDDGGGIVRLSAGRAPEPPPAEPTGFVNPLKNSGGTVFKSDSAGDAGVSYPEKEPEVRKPEVIFRPSVASSNEPDKISTEFSCPAQDSAQGNPQGGPEIDAPGADAAEPTGFVNPLKDSGQTIQWGSDGDRNTQAGEIGEIDSHMGFAIFMTVFVCCDCGLSLIPGIIAIVFAWKVSAYVENGNYEKAKKCSDIALIFCWISLGIKLLFIFWSSISSLTSGIAAIFNL